MTPVTVRSNVLSVALPISSCSARRTVSPTPTPSSFASFSASTTPSSPMDSGSWPTRVRTVRKSASPPGSSGTTTDACTSALSGPLATMLALCTRVKDSTAPPAPSRSSSSCCDAAGRSSSVVTTAL